MDPGIPSARDDGARYPKKVSKKNKRGELKPTRHVL